MILGEVVSNEEVEDLLHRVTEPSRRSVRTLGEHASELFLAEAVEEELVRRRFGLTGGQAGRDDNMLILLINMMCSVGFGRSEV